MGICNRPSPLECRRDFRHGLPRRLDRIHSPQPLGRRQANLAEQVSHEVSGRAPSGTISLFSSSTARQRTSSKRRSVHARSWGTTALIEDNSPLGTAAPGQEDLLLALLRRPTGRKRPRGRCRSRPRPLAASWAAGDRAGPATSLKSVATRRSGARADAEGREPARHVVESVAAPAGSCARTGRTDTVERFGSEAGRPAPSWFFRASRDAPPRADIGPAATP